MKQIKLLKAFSDAKLYKRCKIQLTLAEVARAVGRRCIVKNGGSYLTNSGAKLYSKGGGWYLLAGYSSNGSDIVEDLMMIASPPKTMFISLHTMKFIMGRGLVVYAGKSSNSVTCRIKTKGYNPGRDNGCRQW